METKKISKKNIFLISSLILFLVFSNVAFAMVMDEGKGRSQAAHGAGPVLDHQAQDGKEAPQYVPGEVLVKFKEGIDPTSVLKEVNLEASGIERIHSIKPAVAKFKKDYKLEKTSEGWYSFLGKQYKEIDQVPDEEIFKEAYKTMSEAEKGLYRSYEIRLPEGVGGGLVINKLKSNPDVEYAEPNYIVKVQMVPNDPYYQSHKTWGQLYDDLWALKKMQCDLAWDQTQGEGVIVAVVDTGVDYNHPDLWKNIWVDPDIISDGNNDGVVDLDDCDLNGNRRIDEGELIEGMCGWAFMWDMQTGDPMDTYGHGTHCAGIIAATGNNSLGVIGVAPQAKIMIANGLPGGEGSIEDLSRAVRYVVDKGADVISNSWGGDLGHVSPLEDVFRYAYEHGCVSLAAAGNNNADVESFGPANADTVIAVAATTQNDEKCFFSNYGTKIDICAPGGGYINELGTGRSDMYNVLSTMPDDSYLARALPVCKISNGYWRLAGTSMACPQAAGVAALIRSLFPGAHPDEVRARLRIGADAIEQSNPDYRGLLGAGRINAYRSLTSSPQPDIAVTRIDYHNVKAGQDARINFFIKNLWKPVIGVAGSLSTNDQRVMIRSGVSVFGNIATGQIVNNTQEPFIIALGPDLSIGDRIEFELTLTSEDGLQEVIHHTLFINGFIEIGSRTNLPVSAYSLTGAFPADFDNDNYTDIFFSPGEFSPPGLLYRNNQDLGISFNDVTGSVQYPGHAAVFADFNNDGYRDLLTLSGSGIALYRNQNGLSMTNVTSNSGLGSHYIGAATVIDYNNDKLVDIYAPPYLFRNNGNFRFVNTTTASGLPTSNYSGYWAQQVVFDYNNDGYQDILVNGPSIDFGVDILSAFYRNNGNGTFTDVTAESGLLFPGGATAVAVGDYDNDGDIDAFFSGRAGYGAGISNWPTRSILYRNNGDGTFTDVTIAAGGIGLDIEGSLWGTDFFDYDNDGDLDLLISGGSAYQPKLISLYENNGDGIFSDRAGVVFPPAFRPILNAPCVADFDNDGALDIYCPAWVGGGFLKNLIGNLNNWLKIKLKGTVNNRDGYGVRIYLRTASGQQLREIHASPAENSPIHFGLGHHNIVDDITVCWPNGITQHITGIAANQAITIRDTNRQPELTAIGNKTITKNYLLEFTISGVDPNGDNIIFTAELLPQGAVFDASTRKFSWRPSEDQVGSYVIVFKVSDGELSAMENVLISVQETGSAVIEPIGNKTVDEGQLLTFAVHATDPDGNPLTITKSGSDRGQFINNVYSWTPRYVDRGTYDITFTATDGSLSASETITVTVNDVLSIYGDVSGNGALSGSDCTIMMRYFSGMSVFNDEQRILADVDRNGTINQRDFRLIQRAVVGTITLPVDN